MIRIYEELRTLNDPHTRLPSHCDRNKTPGIDATTGSLGQGASMAVGMALGDRIKGRDTRVFLITGDGELNEGQTWEAAMFAAGNSHDEALTAAGELAKAIIALAKGSQPPEEE